MLDRSSEPLTVLPSLDPIYSSLEPLSEVQNFEDRGLFAGADSLVARVNLGAKLEICSYYSHNLSQVAMLVPNQIITLEAQN